MNLSTWINVFLKPKETFAAEKPNVTKGKVIVNLAVASLLSGILIYVGLLFRGSEAISFVSIIVNVFIFTIIGFLFVIGFLSLVSKIFGGKGKYIELLYLFSIFAVGTNLINGILSIPGPNFIITAILQFVFSIYVIYLFVLAISEVAQLSKLKSFAVWISSVIVLFVILLVLLLVISPFLALS